MKIKITVTGPDGNLIETTPDIQQEGELAASIGTTIEIYRTTYPDSKPFEFTVKVSDV